MTEHYFVSEPSSADERQRVELSVWGRTLSLDTASGVFAAGRLDKGTAVLFRLARPGADARTVLDLGCGYGAIACALGSLVPSAAVWAVDVNARARELTSSNAERLGLQVQVAEPDDVPMSLGFDEIWSNPPIHVGKAALHALLERWLARLTPDGRAVLVVGKNLGADSLQRWLVDGGFTCTRLGSAKGFRVLEVRPSSKRLDEATNNS